MEAIYKDIFFDPGLLLGNISGPCEWFWHEPGPQFCIGISLGHLDFFLDISFYPVCRHADGGGVLPVRSKKILI
jgi:hypothetical protein